MRNLREFCANINTDIVSCTQDGESELADQMGESYAPDATSNSPARLLDQLLASQGASAFQPNFNYRKHL